MAKAMTCEEFIRRAKLVHGDIYGYEKTQYRNMKHKVVIVCRVHGEFSQLPQAHLKGQGCPLCGREKQKQTMLERYGVDNPMKNKDICDKARNTCLSRYGYKWARSAESVQEKCRQTNRERYGTDYALQNDAVKKKMKTTMQQKYGVDYLGQVSDFREKARLTCLERYGNAEPLASKEIRRKIEQTNQERYGGPAPLCSDEIKQRMNETCMDKYGVGHVSQIPAISHRIYLTKKSNGTLTTSKSEDKLYEMLCEQFGFEDVKRQYCSKSYPFSADFYIVSKDLYIELNAHWSHGYGWFEHTPSQCEVFDHWQTKDSDYYRNAISVWTKVDVKKRRVARQNQLNYVVFWDSKLRDATLWFSMNCPLGHDWDRMYSWFPQRDFQVNHNVQLTGTFSNLSKIAKRYQYSVFYRRELDLWIQNPCYRSILLQVFLYYNRLKYLHKSPLELTDMEVLRGFTISGIMKGFTVFDCSLMDRVIVQYGFRSIYDPCAGWGERMLYCFYHNLDYFGVDINPALTVGYQKMQSDFQMRRQFFVCADSSTYVPCIEADAVVTCPPYGHVEHYSDYGAENLSDTEFLQWWSDVVIRCCETGIGYFCFQVNQKWKNRMLSIVLQHDFELVQEFSPDVVKSSHFNRTKDGKSSKKEFESMLVCKRIIANY